MNIVDISYNYYKHEKQLFHIYTLKKFVYNATSIIFNFH